MKPVTMLPALAALLVFAGCGPQDPPAPAVPQKSRTELLRSEFFGAAVAADPAVTWRPNGLGVKIITPGEGETPEPAQRVVVNYTGKLKDGTVFNASPADKPAEFKLGEMIPGMTAGIALLKPGGRAILYIPPSLGYGSLRVGKIPPVSGLVFEVELVAIKP
jgi:FKBP-type peptidyl-prolyl cis-trans isomerase